MIDETKPVQQYLSDEQILPVLKRSRELFAERKRKYGEIRSDEVVAALERIDESDDYAKIIWRVQQENSHDEKYFDTDYLARGITNLKLFYSLEMIDGKNLHSLSKTLDVFWHAHQNFSFEYMGFCNRVFGPNQYLHHTPTDKRDRAIQEAIQRRYDYTRAVLSKIFGADETFWGEDVPICCSYEAKTADGFVFWRPALTAIEPACSLYGDARLNRELRKTTNYVLDGFRSLEG